MTEQSTAAGTHSSDRLVVQAVLKSDVGLVRTENQDSGVYTTAEEESHSRPGGRLMIVADGMGGHRGGATASRLATETVKAQYLGSETEDIPTALRDSITRANARVFTESQSNADLRGMGTTTSALVVRDHDAWIGHVGDSRIYLVRGDEVRQLTEDHSLVATMVREGLLTSEEAENHPRRNVLQKSLGVAEEVEADVLGPLQVQEGDVFILCSDGLHGLVKEEEMKEVARLPIGQAANEFVRRALDRGAPDNVTVIVANVVREGTHQSVGEDTLVEKLAFDETQRDSDTEPLPVQGVGPALAGRPAEAGPTPAQQPAEQQPAEQQPARAPFLKWSLIVALILGAAGAWIFWNSSPTR